MVPLGPPFFIGFPPADAFPEDFEAAFRVVTFLFVFGFPGALPGGDFGGDTPVGGNAISAISSKVDTRSGGGAGQIPWNRVTFISSALSTSDVKVLARVLMFSRGS